MEVNICSVCRHFRVDSIIYDITLFLFYSNRFFGDVKTAEETLIIGAASRISLSKSSLYIEMHGVTRCQKWTKARGVSSENYRFTFDNYKPWSSRIMQRKKQNKSNIDLIKDLYLASVLRWVVVTRCHLTYFPAKWPLLIVFSRVALIY